MKILAVENILLRALTTQNASFITDASTEVLIATFRFFAHVIFHTGYDKLSESLLKSGKNRASSLTLLKIKEGCREADVTGQQ